MSCRFLSAAARVTLGGSVYSSRCAPSNVTQFSELRSSPNASWRMPRTQTPLVWVYERTPSVLPASPRASLIGELLAVTRPGRRLDRTSTIGRPIIGLPNDRASIYVASAISETSYARPAAI